MSELQAVLGYFKALVVAFSSFACVSSFASPVYLSEVLSYQERETLIQARSLEYEGCTHFLARYKSQLWRVTAAHCVATLAGFYEKESRVAISPFADVMAVEVRPEGYEGKWEYVISDSGSLKIGEPVYVPGYPSGDFHVLQGTAFFFTQKHMGFNVRFEKLSFGGSSSPIVSSKNPKQIYGVFTRGSFVVDGSKLLVAVRSEVLKEAIDLYASVENQSVINRKTLSLHYSQKVSRSFQDQDKAICFESLKQYGGEENLLNYQKIYEDLCPSHFDQLGDFSN